MRRRRKFDAIRFINRRLDRAIDKMGNAAEKAGSFPLVFRSVHGRHHDGAASAALSFTFSSHTYSCSAGARSFGTVRTPHRTR